MRLVIFIILFQFSFSLGAKEFRFSPDRGQVTYKTRGWPNLVVIEASGKGVKGVLKEIKNQVSGELSFLLSTLSSGMKSRDDHTLKFLEAEKYPQAKIKFKDLDVPVGFEGKFKFKALLSLHGVEKQVEGNAELKKIDEGFKLTGEFPLNFKDYNISVPVWKGITVAEKVEIKFETNVD